MGSQSPQTIKLKSPKGQVFIELLLVAFFLMSFAFAATYALKQKTKYNRSFYKEFKKDYDAPQRF